MPVQISRLFLILGTALYLFRLELCSADTIAPDRKNLAASLVALDDVLEVFDLQYGVDPAIPAIATSGSFQTTGFQWTTTGTYLGKAINFTAAGTFNGALDRTTWDVTGSYAGFNWSSTGDLRWLSNTSFDTAQDTSIIGVVHAFTADQSGKPSRDEGTSQSNGQVITITYPSSILFGLFSKDDTASYTFPVAPPGTKLTETVVVGTKSAGLPTTIKGVGSLKLETGDFTKTTTITPIPEPRSLALFAVALLGLARLRKRNPRS